ncbi:MAG: hypothetical protein N2747_07930 [Chitinophagaceae bacterium]|nr:hypothetical protein [Chitinophagaceae bacterium]
MTNEQFTNENYGVKKNGNSSRNKNIVIGLLAAALLGSWAYILLEKNKKKEVILQQENRLSTLDSTRAALQQEFDVALARLDSLTGANNELQGQLSEQQKEIEQKKAEIRKILNEKKASETQLAKAKALISELNDKINNLEAEVVRLRQENKELSEANTKLTGEKEELQQSLQASAREKEELTKVIDVGSTFMAGNIEITPVNEKKSGKEKSTATAKKVDKLVVSFDIENRIARSGPADVYLIVTGPDGNVISDASMGSGTLSTRQDGEKPFTTKISFDYTQGERKNIQFPIRNQEFRPGDYKIEIYHNGFKIGEGIRTLKKGGLFG